MTYKRLLVPVDGSDVSERAMDEGLALAKQLGAAVTGFVVEAMPPLPTAGTAATTYRREVSAHEARTAEHAASVLAKFSERAAALGVPFESHHDRADDVAGAIVGAAESHQCDMIVMATHGRGVFGELLFGSFTKSVMSRTKLPMLVLH
jgi:nucleotide-binding universal stress UspA family protein